MNVPFESSAQWKDVHRVMSQAMGRGGEGEELLAAYEERAADLAARIKEERGAVQTRILRVSPDGLSVYLTDSFPGIVAEDVGLDLAGEGDFAQEYSFEQVGELDADHLFLWTFGADATIRSETDAALEQLRAGPLWENLPVVRAGEVTVGGDWWIGSSVIAAERILDDIEAGLLGG